MENTVERKPIMVPEWVVKVLKADGRGVKSVNSTAEILDVGGCTGVLLRWKGKPHALVARSMDLRFGPDCKPIPTVTWSLKWVVYKNGWHTIQHQHFATEKDAIFVDIGK